MSFLFDMLLKMSISTKVHSFLKQCRARSSFPIKQGTSADVKGKKGKSAKVPCFEGKMFVMNHFSVYIWGVVYLSENSKVVVLLFPQLPQCVITSSLIF